MGMSHPSKCAFPLTHQPHPDPTPIVGPWYSMKHSKFICVSQQEINHHHTFELHQGRSSVFPQMHFKGPSTLASASLVSFLIHINKVKSITTHAPWESWIPTGYCGQTHIGYFQHTHTIHSSFFILSTCPFEYYPSIVSLFPLLHWFALPFRYLMLSSKYINHYKEH